MHKYTPHFDITISIIPASTSSLQFFLESHYPVSFLVSDIFITEKFCINGSDLMNVYEYPMLVAPPVRGMPPCLVPPQGGK